MAEQQNMFLPLASVHGAKAIIINVFNPNPAEAERATTEENKESNNKEPTKLYGPLNRSKLLTAVEFADLEALEDKLSPDNVPDTTEHDGCSRISAILRAAKWNVEHYCDGEDWAQEALGDIPWEKPEGMRGVWKKMKVEDGVDKQGEESEKK